MSDPCRRFVPAMALATAMSLARGSAMAKPEWAKPFLDLPTPAGGYIAKNDPWAVVYGEIEVALTERSTIEARYRILIENLSDRPEVLTTVVPCDESVYDLKEPTLHVQRIIWHQINLRKKADKVSVKGVTQLIVASAEDIEPHKKVFLEYTLSDKLGFLPWMTLFIPRTEPVAKLHLTVEPASAQRGLVLELRWPVDEPPSSSFVQEQDGSWTVSQVPARSRITTHVLAYQPAITDLYPYFLARASRDPAESFAGLVRRYRTAWNERLEAVDIAQVQARAQSTVVGAGSAAEKAARLAGFVQHDVQNDDSNESSLDAWVPLTTQETLRSMKADCKGKAMLLHALLKSVGISSAPVLMHLGLDYSSWGDRPGTAFIDHALLAIAVPGDVTYGATLLEGPGKGMVLFDPTRSTAAFGEPLPGYEGQTALLVGDADEPRFTIHTRAPSLVTFDARLDVRVGDDGTASIKAHATDNGGSYVMTELIRGGTLAQHKELLVRVLGERLPRAHVVREAVIRPAVFPPGPGQVDLEFSEPQSLQELGQSSLLPNPLGLGALLAGLPSSLRPSQPARPDDMVALAAPWDCKLNVHGLPMVIDIQARLALPSSVSWTPPPPHIEERPWVKLSENWTAGGDNTYEGRLHLELPRGRWPKEDRHDRLKLMDDLYTGLASPLILSNASSKSSRFDRPSVWLISLH